jgi:hypothetical protein
MDPRDSFEVFIIHLISSDIMLTIGIVLLVSLVAAIRPSIIHSHAREAKHRLMKRADAISIASNTLEVGFDKGRGAGLFHFALKGQKNVVNHADTGRLIQQSYYSSDLDGTSWPNVSVFRRLIY